ncbi:MULTISPECIES: prephenate dehydrogenase [unclassified Staphylococcus]|uniref:prephenate dehydrogenase n=1 Tax=unclassified Staphylococcus TaxID=91994 RepID=UPI0021D278B6|nr:MULTISPECIES: prephenate dehydrogenase [unclassified Staphylococcus]UXR68801.1 prephenate dehydrogenase [Staphylococcus sp. IVB6246]UXR73088.1 prephenate dehydrogenase [Staphylococcus sp. IVB6238]UXR75384.1 prephenate dehydrogenase [Staphylococcus sp. IVB6233]UXR79587.1 prephenate dehydrogenase [Staphylococcus sp. IVB6218]
MSEVFFIGLGLIGGSLASNIKNAHPEIEVTAYDADPKQLERALSIGIIDKPIDSFETGAKQADIMIFATPVQTTVKYLDLLQTIETKTGLIVTDTGSTKSTIQAHERTLLKHGIHLIGGHPMAGSHKTGVLNAKKHLFENAYYVLVHDLPENEAAFQRISQLLEPTQAKLLKMTAEEHDYVTGVVSHTPHLIASSLVSLNAHYAPTTPLVQELAAGGFRDITRIASSSPEMWRDISLENKSHILKIMKQFQSQIDEVIHSLETEDASALYRFFSESKTYRDALPIQSKGALRSTYDLYVDIPDKAGTISKITHILSSHNISISNLRILELREDIYGALRISFKSSEDREQGRVVLNEYETYIE